MSNEFVFGIGIQSPTQKADSFFGRDEKILKFCWEKVVRNQRAHGILGDEGAIIINFK